jgi:hypothetical protein
MSHLLGKKNPKYRAMRIPFIDIQYFFVTKAVYLSRLCGHHQPINVPTAGAQSFLMDFT